MLLVLVNSNSLSSQTAPASLFEKIDSIKTVLKTAKKDSSRVRTLWWLSRTYSDFYNYRDSPVDYYMDSAIKFAKLALELSNMASGSPRQKCICLGRLADIYTAFNPAEGLKYMFASIKECQASGHQVNVSNAYHNISNILSRFMGDHSEALKYNLAALEIRKKINIKHYIAASYNNIKNNYYSMGKYEQALSYAWLGFKNEEENLSKEELGNYHISIGACYAQLGNFDESLKYLHDALTTFQELNLQEPKYDGWLARIYVCLGISYAKRASQITYPESKEMYIKALEYLNKGLSIWPMEELRREAFPVLSEIYKKMGDFENALEYKNRLTALNDSILNYETQNRMAHVRIEHETEKAIAEQKANNEKLIIEERARQSIALAEEKAFGEKIFSEQKIQHEKDLAEEKNLNQIKLAEEKFFQEKKAEQEKLEYDQSIGLEKAKQESLMLEKKRTKQALMIGVIGISMISCLLILLIRQKITKRRAIERAEALHKMVELELQSLRAQLNPHFMFNSLNAIQELILKEDNDNCHLYLSRFSELLRMLLDNANRPFVSLKKEVSLLDLYLSLENLRIPDLKYSIEIDPSIDTTKMTIPNMMIQPYIENAIWHGLSHKKGERNLKIRITRKQDNIVCEIEDNGVGRKMSTELRSLYRKEHRSRGMELLSKRFNLLSKEYGTDIQTIVEDLHDNGTATGTKVAITIPNSLTEQASIINS